MWSLKLYYVTESYVFELFFTLKFCKQNTVLAFRFLAYMFCAVQNFSLNLDCDQAVIQELEYSPEKKLGNMTEQCHNP